MTLTGINLSSPPAERVSDFETAAKLILRRRGLWHGSAGAAAKSGLLDDFDDGGGDRFADRVHLGFVGIPVEASERVISVEPARAHLKVDFGHGLACNIA
jgi:hypothetical protein